MQQDVAAYPAEGYRRTTFTVMTIRCPSCGRASLRVLPFPTQFCDVAYFRCLHCGDVWTMGRDKAEAARRVTQREGTHEPEQAVLFTCPECQAALTFEDVTVHEKYAIVTFACATHGHFTFTDDHGLTPARTV